MSTIAPTPTVGTLATIYVGSDRYPAEVIQVNASGDNVTTRAMSVLGSSSEGFDAYANGAPETFTLAPNPTGQTTVWTRRKNGDYLPKGRNRSSGYGVAFGQADFYRDPSF